MDVTYPGTDDSVKARRVFLRIPVKIPARIFLERHYYKKVQLDEISTTGFSFCLRDPKDIPDELDVDFRLGFFNAIKAKAVVKNRIPLPRGMRVGCKFLEIPDADAALITAYINRFTRFSLPLELMGVASLVCLVDSLLRVTAFLLYYEGARFEKIFTMSLAEKAYGGTLLLYAFCAAVAFLFGGRISDPKEKRRFLMSLACFIVPLAFVVFKNIAYVRIWPEYAGKPFMALFFAGYAFLAVYAAFTAGIALRSLDKIDIVLDILGKHRSALNNEGGRVL